MADAGSGSDVRIYEDLTTIFRDVFADASISLTPTMTARDIAGWDSGRMIELIVAAEERFAIRFTSREVDRLENVGDFVRTIVAKQAA